MPVKKNVLIIGGVGDIGEALARRLCRNGWRVVVTSRSLDRASALAREIGAVPAAVDIHDQGSIEAAVVAATEGDLLSGLAYCIGSIPLKPLASTTSEDMLETYRLNVVGAMLGVRAASAALRAA
jgi:NAD(P)-dependent dehydrogenase (short-subunit alcohol dehydrogenase family)